VTAARRPAHNGSTIGAVLARLRPDFPDVTISKIRFLEAEGLISPERTPSGYRRFSEADVARLRFVLAAQRDHYLPLKVIKEQLDQVDRGESEAVTAVQRPARELTPVPSAASPVDFVSDPGIRLTRLELIGRSGVGEGLLSELEQYGLVRADEGGGFDADTVQVARTASLLAEYGIEPRHLRAFRASADREVDLLEQVVAPMYRQRDPAARERADGLVRDLAALSVGLHTLLVKAALRRVTGG